MKQGLILGICLSAILGCSREVGNKSKIRFEAPSSSQGTMAALPVGQTACYGVSIKGGVLSGGAVNSCSPSLGVIAGYASSGQTLELEVPKGSGYQIELYLYLMDSGDTSPCPQFTKSFSASDLNHVYLVGTASDVNLTKNEEVVTITSFFPGVGSTIASSFLPSCTAAANPNPSFLITSGAGAAGNASYKLIGRVGRVPSGQVLSGGGYKVITNK